MTKDEKIKELLKVLDMNEDEQEKWVYLNPMFNNYFEDDDINSIADLAFRMRDKAVGISTANYMISEQKIYDYIFITLPDNQIDISGYRVWFELYAQPIHWIIAALIAEVLNANS